METTTLQTTRQNLPPTEIDCKWRKQGHCFRGNKCLFRHNPALEGIDRSGAEKCLEILSVYGLLLNCGHVFCLGIWFSVQHCGCFARSYIYEIITIILRRGSTKRFPRRTTTHKKLAGHALFVVLTAISLFPVYFSPFPSKG